jgi:1-deoxy-D-xylulose-5-phosphate reductoisomerase
MGNRLKIAIAGITGSIGTSAVNIIRNHSDRFQIVLASAHSNARGLLDLAREFKIENLVITNGVKLSTNSENKKIYRGHEELYKLIQETDFDIFLNAMPGSNGLLTSYHVLKAGKKLALANKESLVLAGHILTKMAKANNQPKTTKQTELTKRQSNKQTTNNN